MAFVEGQYYMCEMPSGTANDAAGRTQAISAVRKHFMASSTFGGEKPAMIVVMVPENARDDASRLIRETLNGDILHGE